MGKCKAKTNKGAAKRFKLTKSGKIKRNKANKNHILTKKEQSRKRDLRAATLVSDADTARVKKMLNI